MNAVSVIRFFFNDYYFLEISRQNIILMFHFSDFPLLRKKTVHLKKTITQSYKVN